MVLNYQPLAYKFRHRRRHLLFVTISLPPHPIGKPLRALLSNPFSKSAHGVINRKRQSWDLYILVSQEASQRGAEGLSRLISQHSLEMVQSSAFQVNGGHAR